MRIMSGSEGEEPPGTLFTGLHRAIKDTPVGDFFAFNSTDRHLGQYWFEAVMFSLSIVILLSLVAFFAGRRQQKVPRGIQNFGEAVVDLLTKLVCGMIGPHGTKYVPYLGTLFLYIFAMNILGIIPLFRSPTMTLSTTLALGITTFFVVQYCGIRANGVGGYLKHFMGPVLFLAPLMIVVEFIGEVAKPMSLSLRLYGNIFGE
ncbi:MAG: ATP synthase F0 subunit A, partial [Planctomycetes bacterium RBG_16_59_8]